MVFLQGSEYDLIGGNVSTNPAPSIKAANVGQHVPVFVNGQQVERKIDVTKIWPAEKLRDTFPKMRNDCFCYRMSEDGKNVCGLDIYVSAMKSDVVDVEPPVSLRSAITPSAPDIEEPVAEEEHDIPVCEELLCEMAEEQSLPSLKEIGCHGKPEEKPEQPEFVHIVWDKEEAEPIVSSKPPASRQPVKRLPQLVSIESVLQKTAEKMAPKTSLPAKQQIESTVVAAEPAKQPVPAPKIVLPYPFIEKQPVKPVGKGVPKEPTTSGRYPHEKGKRKVNSDSGERRMNITEYMDCLCGRR
jgi:hypothetical protein